MSFISYGSIYSSNYHDIHQNERETQLLDDAWSKYSPMLKAASNGLLDELKSFVEKWHCNINERGGKLLCYLCEYDNLIFYLWS
jgi:hypothetical protein